jgi:hypothetical protein
LSDLLVCYRLYCHGSSGRVGKDISVLDARGKHHASKKRYFQRMETVDFREAPIFPFETSDRKADLGIDDKHGRSQIDRDVWIAAQWRRESYREAMLDWFIRELQELLLNRLRQLVADIRNIGIGKC